MLNYIEFYVKTQKIHILLLNECIYYQKYCTDIRREIGFES